MIIIKTIPAAAKHKRRPWYTPPPDGHGREEIVGPGGFAQAGQACARAIDVIAVSYELCPLVESPIELDIGTQLVLQLADTDLTVIPQYSWLRYRIDFALVRDGQPLLFIECDGKEFHSSPEQIENDRRKNEAAQTAGIPLMRFTGSEIYNNAYACAALAIAEACR